MHLQDPYVRKTLFHSHLLVLKSAQYDPKVFAKIKGIFLEHWNS